MPRKRREESSTGVYHWIVRGMNKKDLFHDDQDFECFRKLLFEYKTAYQSNGTGSPAGKGKE